ncbi:hypothetical protein OH77DRAFT_593557 [Trametes cingulata]|nr:hypothetical protein OH77DRAFT_593557 [Trametes cingulata]
MATPTIVRPARRPTPAVGLRRKENLAMRLLLTSGTVVCPRLPSTSASWQFSQRASIFLPSLFQRRSEAQRGSAVLHRTSLAPRAPHSRVSGRRHQRVLRRREAGYRCSVRRHGRMHPGVEAAVKMITMCNYNWTKSSMRILSFSSKSKRKDMRSSATTCLV